VEHHHQHHYSADLETVFTTVTGRRLPVNASKFDHIERLVFLPSCHIGPYVAFHPLEQPEPALVLHYNCRPTAVPEADQAPAIQDLFPPVKALADETRLQILSILDGRELYAQQIVAQLDISQSAVSRHLQLMEAGGLLNVEKQDSMKFYSINEATLEALAEKLQSYRGKPAA
jgi:DNA-binding transcriptional ArsR family regulator